jgi:phosphate transport system substrate-binding protein
VSLLGATLLLMLLLASCQQTRIMTPESVTITVAGATAMQPVLVDLSSEFSRQHPHVLFDITGGDSTVGEERLYQGQVDLAVSTLISPALAATVSKDTANRTISPWQRIPIGLDGLAIIVHTSNPITNVTLLQLQELYSGRIWNWQALGGNDESVQLVTRETGSGSNALFTERVLSESSMALTAVVMPTSADVVEFVAATPGAIGYVSRAYVMEWLAPPPATAEPTATPPFTIRLLQLENQQPTDVALQTQSYFLIQPLYLISRRPPRDPVKQFIDFVLSNPGQRIVARYHDPIR